jgi:hypothetical protein
VSQSEEVDVRMQMLLLEVVYARRVVGSELELGDEEESRREE